MAPLRVVFMGTPEFAVPTLKALNKNSDVANLLCVYTQPDRPAGRGQKLTMPPVKVLANELGLSVFQPENINDADEKRKLADLMADVVVVVAYAQFLSKAVLNTPRLGCVNVHSSLLPKYRGAAPIQYAIWNGENESGVSTMRLVPKMDAGPVFLQEKISITADMTAKNLHDQLSEIGAQLLIRTLRGLQAGTLDEMSQDETLVSYAHLIKKENGMIDWTLPGFKIFCQVRAFDPWPGTYAKTNRGNLKIHKVLYHPDPLSGAPKTAIPGEIFTGVGGLFVRCKDGWIELLVVQPEGKSRMEIQQFLNGIQNVRFNFE